MQCPLNQVLTKGQERARAGVIGLQQKECRMPNMASDSLCHPELRSMKNQ